MRKSFKTILGESIGEASMCWSETPKGVFESTRASEIFHKVFSAHELEVADLESKLKTAIEALNNILNEGNMAMQGHWDSTEKMKNISYETLTQLEDKLRG